MELELSGLEWRTYAAMFGISSVNGQWSCELVAPMRRHRVVYVPLAQLLVLAAMARGTGTVMAAMAARTPLVQHPSSVTATATVTGKRRRICGCSHMAWPMAAYTRDLRGAITGWLSRRWPRPGRRSPADNRRAAGKRKPGPDPQIRKAEARPPGVALLLCEERCGRSARLAPPGDAEHQQRAAEESESCRLGDEGRCLRGCESGVVP